MSKAPTASKSTATSGAIANSGTKPVRCAIYCRKSSDEGLEQSFNSLDAQRSSAESYIAAQKGQGWVCISDHYDDGGFSGGDMDRPGLQRLMADIEAGRVDRVVVYKLDRLTRSIRDFGRIVDVFDRRGVSLVSVTQALDTGTSMGRLMLHVLLSFAQFERELASERTRDKIALSRQRGLWTGGRPILGYDIRETKLVVNADEAPVVREIFGRYLELRSLRLLVAELRDKGVNNKTWTTKEGRVMGGGSITKGRLWQLLTNPLYVGRVPHKTTTYPGAHTAIIEEAVFTRLQEILAENGRAGPSQERNRHGGVLKGLIHCARCGRAMTHTTTKKPKSTTTYRYYVCHERMAMGRGSCSGGLVPAEQVEQFVLGKVRDAFAEPALVSMVLDAARARDEQVLRDLDARRILLQTDLEQAEAVMRGKGGAAAAERHESIAEHLRCVDRQIAETRDCMVDRATVQHGLDAFDPLWACLSPIERNRLLSLVVERIDFDGEAGEITIRRHDEGESPTSEAAA